MSTLNVDKVDPSTGTTLELGTSGDTLNVPSGVTLDINSGATLDATGATITGAIGKVLQVVNTLATVNGTTTSGTYGDIGLSRTITCTATTSKVVVIATVPCKNYNDVQSEAQFQMLRDSTTLGTQYVGYAAMGSDDVLLDSIAFTYLDSPSSTSELTFKVQARLAGGSGTVQYGFGVSNGCSLTCMEIGA